MPCGGPAGEGPAWPPLRQSWKEMIVLPIHRNLRGAGGAHREGAAAFSGQEGLHHGSAAAAAARHCRQRRHRRGPQPSALGVLQAASAGPGGAPPKPKERGRIAAHQVIQEKATDAFILLPAWSQSARYEEAQPAAASQKMHHSRSMTNDRMPRACAGRQAAGGRGHKQKDGQRGKVWRRRAHLLSVMQAAAAAAAGGRTARTPAA